MICHSFPLLCKYGKEQRIYKSTIVNVKFLICDKTTFLQEFNLHLLLRITWFDERLRPWNATVAKGKPVTILEGGSWHLDRLWTPSLHVPNSKVPNILQDRTQNPVLTRIQSDGQILVSKRYSSASALAFNTVLIHLIVSELFCKVSRRWISAYIH